MKRPPFTDVTLEKLRAVGDPAFDAVDATGQPDFATYFASVARNGVAGALDAVNSPWSDCATTAAKDDAEASLTWHTDEFEVDPADLMMNARDLFAMFGDEISAALLLAALPETYATAWGARVLVGHGDLVWQLPRRIRQTALFLATVLSKDTVLSSGKNVIDTESPFFKNCAGLRLFHHMLRLQLQADSSAMDHLGDKNKMPLNQEDLLGTLLTFSVTTLRVMIKFGVSWSADDQDAYLFFWDLVGACLGIGTDTVRSALEGDLGKNPLPSGWSTLRPSTVDTAGALLDQLHARQWLPVQEAIGSGHPFPWDDLVHGRALVDALLRALCEAMPPMKKPWPAIVMRELAPTIVQSRLGLDRAGLLAYAVDNLAPRTTWTARSRAAGLRAMANDVTRHAMYSFLTADGPAFVIPGLDLSQLTPPVQGMSLEFK